VAAAGARLRRLSVDETMHALLITEQHSPGLLSADLHGFGGSHVKEGIAWAVVTGILALDLARNGFRGYPETLDKPQLYRGNMITEGLGTQFTFLGTFFKPYACCRWIHPAIDGFGAILKNNELPINQIREVQIFTFQKAANLENSISPVSPEQAQFSIPFILGTVACFGIDNLLPLKTDLIGDQAITAFGSKVKIEVDSDFESCFPKQTISRVVVKSDYGQFEEIVDYPWGDPKNPMARNDLQKKFRILTRGWLTETDQIELIQRASEFREQTFSNFISLLGKRLSPVQTSPEQ
jgi:2-methylcitrate dehydratase PrpD